MRPRDHRPAGRWIVLGLLSGMSFPASAQVASMGTAGAYTLQARGVEAPSWNAATLAWGPELRVGLFAVGGSARNNSFSLKDYNGYNGSVWSEQDKREILDRIPGSTFDGRFAASVQTAGAARNGWAVTLESFAAGEARLGKDFARLLLFGNDPEVSFDLQGSDGEGLAWSEFRLSHGREVGAFHLGLLGEGAIPLALGASVKVLHGWGYGEVVQAAGGLTTSMDGISGRATVRARTAQGGDGFGLDLGAAARTPRGWDLAVGIHNALSLLSWNRETEQHMAEAYADSLSMDDLDEDEEGLVRDSTSSVSIPKFHRGLAPVLLLAAGRRIGRTYVETDLRQGISDGPGSSLSPRMSAGASHPLLSWLVIRGGLAVGGGDGMVWAGGLGFAVWKIRMDLAATSLGGGNPFSPKGVGGGLSLGLDWSKITFP